MGQGEQTHQQHDSDHADGKHNSYGDKTHHDIFEYLDREPLGLCKVRIEGYIDDFTQVKPEECQKSEH